MEFESHAITNFKELKQFNPSILNRVIENDNDRYIIKHLRFIYGRQSFYVSIKGREYVILNDRDSRNIFIYHCKHFFNFLGLINSTESRIGA